MNIDKINSGDNLPESFNVIIEVSQNSLPIKYEFDKDSGALFVDRIIQTSMHYPCNYGFIPKTLSDDGDPVDVLVVGQFPIVPGAVIKCRPLGVLMMEDESGQDEKILAAPIAKVDPFYSNVSSYNDLPEILLEKISHFFENYKKLEKNKWVKVTGWQNEIKAKEIILLGKKNYQE